MENKWLKRDVLNELFELEVINSQQRVTTRINCKNKALNAHFNNLHRKYSFKISYDTFFTECIYWSFQALEKFTLESGSWEGVLDGTNQKGRGQLINYIKTTVENQAIRFANPDTLFTTRKVNGKREHVQIELVFSSLDALIMDSEGDQSTLINSIAENQNHLDRDTRKYKINHFVAWFENTKHLILQDSQLKLLEELPEALNDDSKTFNGAYLQEELGILPNNLPKYLDRIKERTLKAYLTEFPNGVSTLKQSKATKRYKRLKNFFQRLNKEELPDQEVYRWIYKIMEETWANEALEKALTLEERINLNLSYQGRAALSKKTAYKAINALYEEMNRYKEVMEEEIIQRIYTDRKKATEELTQPGPYQLDTYGNLIPKYGNDRL